MKRFAEDWVRTGDIVGARIFNLYKYFNAYMMKLR